MNTVYDISLVEFICNLLPVSSFWHSETSSYINCTYVYGLAALYEKEHENAFVATTPEDIKWMSNVTNTKFRKEGNIFVVSADVQDYIETFQNEEMITWFKEKANLGYESIYKELDCMYILN